MSAWPPAPTVDTVLALATLLAPLAVLVLVAVRHTRRRVPLLMPWSALPALALALFADDFVREIPGLFGMRVGLDGLARPMLFFAALAWLLIGLSARQDPAVDVARVRFAAFAAAAMLGNVGAILAQHVEGFHFFFALMVYSTYGLVVHGGAPRVRRAGRAYLVAAVLADTLLVFALMIASGVAGSEQVDAVSAALAQRPNTAVFALLLAAFGARVGLIGLHVALPPAARVSPVPAAAAVFGPLAAAGVFGWLRFLPLGSAAVPAWSSAFMVLGIAGAGLGFVFGLRARGARTLLAYAAIGQGGYAMIALGMALRPLPAAAVGATAVLQFAITHLAVITALFFVTGFFGKGGDRLPSLARATAAGSMFAFVLAGILLVPAGGHVMGVAMAFAATVLMVRFRDLLTHVRSPALRREQRVIVGLAALLAALLSLVLAIARMGAVPPLVPFAAAVVIAVGIAWRWRWGRGSSTSLLLLIVERAAFAVVAAWRSLSHGLRGRADVVDTWLAAARRWGSAFLVLERYELLMGRIAGAVFVLLLIAVFVVLSAR